MEVLRGWVFSYRQGTPVTRPQPALHFGYGFKVTGLRCRFSSEGFGVPHGGLREDPRVEWSNLYRGTSPTRKRTPLGPYRRPLPRVLGGSWWGARFLMSELPLWQKNVPSLGTLTFQKRFRVYREEGQRDWGLEFGFGVWGLGAGVWGLGLGFGVRDLWFEVCGLWFVVCGLWFGVWCLKFGVWGLVLGVWGLRFEVWGSGVWV